MRLAIVFAIVSTATAWHLPLLDVAHGLPQLGHATQGMLDGHLHLSTLNLAQAADAAAQASAPGPWGTFRGFVQGSIVNLHDFLKGHGVEQAYGYSIVLFTMGVKLLLLPLNYKQLESGQKTSALTPLQDQIKEKYRDDKSKQQALIAALFTETQVNPLAGCLPSLVQIPVFIALYRSLLRLAAGGALDEPFLWIPSLSGPQFGYHPGHMLEWLTNNWVDGVPPMGWHDTGLYLIMPVVLFFTQSISLKILSPPTQGDPQMERTQRILSYLPWMITYFAANSPAGLGVYWLINNLGTTVQSFAIKEYFKQNPVQFENVDLASLENLAQQTTGGLKYTDYLDKREKYLDEALVHALPPRPRRRLQTEASQTSVEAVSEVGVDVDVGAAAK